MLFLAVFCGFLAEYQLEHKIEKNREKQYMHSMIKDLNTDLTNMSLTLAEKERMIKIGDSISQIFIAGNHDQQTGRIYYYARNFSTLKNLFLMTDGTLRQLKNSGGLRLYRLREAGKTARRAPGRVCRENPRDVVLHEGLRANDRILTSSYATFNDVDELDFTEPVRNLTTDNAGAP